MYLIKALYALYTIYLLLIINTSILANPSSQKDRHDQCKVINIEHHQLDPLIEEVQTSNKGLLLMFYNPWCLDCKKIFELMESLSHKYCNLTQFAILDAELSMLTMKRFNIFNFPQLTYFINNQMYNNFDVRNNAQLEYFLERGYKDKKPENIPADFGILMTNFIIIKQSLLVVYDALTKSQFAFVAFLISLGASFIIWIFSYWLSGILYPYLQQNKTQENDKSKKSVEKSNDLKPKND